MKDSKTGITTRYYYDTVGRLSRQDESGPNRGHILRYQYDGFGNVAERKEFIGSTLYTTQYGYDSQNRPAVVISGDAAESYEYDDFSRLETVTTYHDSEGIIQRTLTYAANSDRVASLSYAFDADIGFAYEYTYDGNGNITSLRYGQQEIAYTYDSANQLIREDNSRENKTWVWTYDDAGNILSKKEYAYTTGTLGTVLDTISYQYSTSAWKDLLVSYDGKGLSYDDVGNPLSDGTWTYTWEQGRQLASMSYANNNWLFTYDANGMRTSRRNQGTTYTYWYHGSQLSRMDYGNISMKFTYGADGTPISINYDGITYYYVVNLQGDVVGILNASGTQVVGYVYDAWGRLIKTTGSMAPSLGLYNPLRYRGYVYDRETGLYYVQSRYYNPTIGRWINADSQLSTGDLTGLNLFAYCGNNPVNRTDPTGEAWWHWAVAAVVVVAAAAAVVVTAGGAAAGMAAVASVASGVAAGTTAATVASGVFIGSATAFAGSVYIAAMQSDSLQEFADHGEMALAMTTTGGIMGGMSAYASLAPKPSQCFVAGTLVHTQSGSVPIEEIRAGDMVWAWDEETGETALKPVVETYINESTELVHISVNGETITTTPKHPFYSPVKGWTEAAQLRAGDILVLVNGEYVVVEKIQHEILETPIAVYNFEVEDFHTYYVGSTAVLVHNKCVYEQTVSSREEALGIGRKFLGEGYTKEGPGRYVSLDRYRQMRFDFTHHDGTSHHINLETFKYKILPKTRNKLIGDGHIFW